MDKVQKASIGGLVAIMVYAGVAAAQLSGQSGTAISGDFRNAAVAEVQDSSGRVLLQGSFTVANSDPDEVERVATLAAASGDVKAAGEAEVEYSAASPNEQEVEFSVTGLSPETEVVLLIDGQRVTSAKTDRRGRVDVELTVRSGA